MRVAGAEAGIELCALVGHIVTIGVFEEPDVGRGTGDDAVFVKAEAGDELELVSKDVLLVHDAVAIGVGEDGDAVGGIAVVCFGPGAGVLPLLDVQLAAAIRILRRLADPEATFFIPIDIHDLVDQRLTGDERDVELRMHLDFLSGLFRPCGATFDVAEVVAEFVRLAEFVRVFALTCPSDAAQQKGAHGRVAEVFVIVTGDAGEGAVSRGADTLVCTFFLRGIAAIF